MSRFNPYEDNGGTVAFMIGKDYALIASDTRLVKGSTILSRDVAKIYPLTSAAVIGAAGFHGDALTLVSNLKVHLQEYRYEHNEEMPTKALIAMMLPTLYSKRFFPFYLRPIVAGLDVDGGGVAAAYDPVGTPEFYAYQADGAAGALIQPFLQAVIGTKSVLSDVPVRLPDDWTLDRSATLLKDAFTAAAERDVQTGDELLMVALTATGIETKRYALRDD